MYGLSIDTSGGGKMLRDLFRIGKYFFAVPADSIGFYHRVVSIKRESIFQSCTSPASFAPEFCSIVLPNCTIFYMGVYRALVLVLYCQAESAAKGVVRWYWWRRGVALRNIGEFQKTSKEVISIRLSHGSIRSSGRAVRFRPFGRSGRGQLCCWCCEVGVWRNESGSTEPENRIACFVR